MRLVWQDIDPLLNAASARLQPIYLYELQGSRGRVAWESSAAGQEARVTENRPTRVSLEASSPVGGRLILTDLMYPGWNVTVDDGAAEPQLIEGVYRGVAVPAGTHTVVWSYQPRVVYRGLPVSRGDLDLRLSATAYPARRRTRSSGLCEPGHSWIQAVG